MSDTELKVYCGSAEKPPKGKKLGTLKECTDSGQIRRWGAKKAKKEKVEKYKKERAPKVNVEKLAIELMTLRGRRNRLKKDIEDLENRKRLGKEYDADLLKQHKDDLLKWKKKGIEISKQIQGAEKTGSGVCCLRGGKISAKLLKQLFEKDDFTDIGDYKMDKDLSTEWVRVLHNPKTNHTIVVHRGSAEWMDIIYDAMLGVGYKNNKRFKESKRIQGEAEKKYGTSNMSVVGSSLGATLSENYGKNAGEIITSGKPVTPLDLIMGKTPHKTQHDVRTHTDIISFLKPLQKHENDITVKSIDPKDPVKSHLGKHTMEAVMDKHGDDIEIGEEGVGGAVKPNFKKMKVAELKNYIKVNRKAKKLKAKDFQLGGKKKPELCCMCDDIYNAS